MFFDSYFRLHVDQYTYFFHIFFTYFLSEVGRVVLQVLGTGMAALAQVDIGAIFSYPGVTLPQLLDESSDDLIFSTTQAALFGGCTRNAAVEESTCIIIQYV